MSCPDWFRLSIAWIHEEVFTMTTVSNQIFDEERAFYAAKDLVLQDCRFEGPADGESALKEATNIKVDGCFMNLRYPFWHDDHLKIYNTTLTENCRAALWYSKSIEIADCTLNGIKAVRECDHIRIKDTEIKSPEFGWSSHHLMMDHVNAVSEYFLMRTHHLDLRNVTLQGKYSFQYVKNAMLENCTLDTKDCLWHAKNVVVRNCVVKGEYLAWYSEDIVFDHCKIIGTQPLCYCKNLTLIDCEMVDTDLSFERSEVDATLTAPIESIKNPLSGTITVPYANQVIMDLDEAKGVVIETEKQQD